MTKRPTRPRSTTNNKRSTTSPTRTSSARSSGRNIARPRGTARKSTRKARKPAVQLTPAQRNWLIGVLLLTIALVTFLSLTRVNLGTLTASWVHWLRHALGRGAWGAPVALTALGLWVITRSSPNPLRLSGLRALGALLLFAAYLALAHYFQSDPAAIVGGGVAGQWLSTSLIKAIGVWGSIVLLLVMTLVGLTLTFDIPMDELLADGATWLREVRLSANERQALRQAERANRQATPEPIINGIHEPQSRRQAAHVPLPGQAAPHEPPRVPGARLPAEPEDTDAPQFVVGDSGRRWALPDITQLLAVTQEAQMSLPDIRAKTAIIEETLTSLGVPVTVVEVNPGPVVTQFGLEPGYVERRDRQGRVKQVKVKVSRIATLSNDLALALAASPIRIEAPVPGKGIVGIEVPNRESAIVGLRGVMESEQFRRIASSHLAICLGRDVSGQAVVADLGRLPHLLIAGATGTGKSVCINSLVTCLLSRNTPDSLRLLMIDPKRVELSNFNGIPHLLGPVVVEPQRAAAVLRYVAREMDRRYKVFERARARNIEIYNHQASERGESRMPYIVVFIDELADLMMIASDEVEKQVCRIAQLARATGIHLVIATQRPSVDVVTGLIKANFPARMAFAVTSLVDSRVIIDAPGADKLLGRGDGLYMPPDSPKLERVQGCWVADSEIYSLVRFWQQQAGSPPAPDEGGDQAAADPPVKAEQPPLWPTEQPEDEESGDDDPLLNEAVDIVAREGKASVSYLQRRLRIGYTRAARLVDAMEDRNIVGPPTGSSKPRDVYVKSKNTSRQD
jgi:S-DNA-T family DNA segregation ATPase FtsK/SpoIIIE